MVRCWPLIGAAALRPSWPVAIEDATRRVEPAAVRGAQPAKAAAGTGKRRGAAERRDERRRSKLKPRSGTEPAQASRGWSFRDRGHADRLRSAAAKRSRSAASPGGKVVETRSGDRPSSGRRTVFRRRPPRGRRGPGCRRRCFANGTLGWMRLDPERSAPAGRRTRSMVDLSERRGQLLDAATGRALVHGHGRVPGTQHADRALRGHRHLPRRPQPGLRLLRGRATARQPTCPRAGSAATGSRSTAPGAARRSRLARLRPGRRTRGQRSWSSGCRSARRSSSAPESVRPRAARRAPPRGRPPPGRCRRTASRSPARPKKTPPS